jgi:predicted Fe-Mo cluster-binding NifX family protein
MKIALCAQDKSQSALLDPRFGRCRYFALIDTAKETWEFIPNPGATSGGGAGIQAAQELASRNIQAVIAGQLGPNAMSVLQAAGIKVYSAAGNTVQEAYQNFLNNNAELLKAANAPPHAGIKSK